MRVEFSITDDSGFLGIVNAARYDSFIGEDWELDQLMDRIVHEANRGHILFWGTGGENEWRVIVSDVPISKGEHRSFVGKILVTNGALYLTNYESLSMAAQYEDEQLPPAHMTDSCVSLENGAYEVTARQLRDPDVFDYDDNPIAFELVLRHLTDPDAANPFTDIPWHS